MPKVQNHLGTEQKCSGNINQGNKRPKDDDPDVPNFNLGLCDLLQIEPEEEQSLLKQLFTDDMPIPQNPNEAVT